MGSIMPEEQQQQQTIKPTFAQEANTLEYAQSLDAKDHMRSFREKFIIPSKSNIKTKKVVQPESEDPCIYFCGNSLGLQPRATREYISKYLDTWATIGVHGHFRPLENSPMIQWQLLAEDVSRQFAPIVGASPSEVGIMASLTVNLHLLMASFYTPTATKNKIILDWKAFPSDHFAIESQIRQHGYNPEESMILIGPEEGTFEVTTEKILSVIDEHASTTALLLLPGIQYYTGQFFDMKTITAYAQSKGLTVGWDLAHAVGNVPLQLHDWNVDFAVWCTYKYLNSGPGGVGGFYVHERHGTVDYSQGENKPVYRHRLAGWYGGDQVGRMNMQNNFRPSPGASGYQVSTSSTVELASLSGSLSVFNQTSMSDIRAKSVKLTAYLETLLHASPHYKRGFSIITPSNPDARGTQLSVLLADGRLDTVSDMLEQAGIVADKRKPGVIRIAPVPLYNTYAEVWSFVQIFNEALGKFE
ncbi:Kynureninase (L-kynurenine hydrolase) [Cadophora malorum]|uniref:Kynureninase n=1 Tax=Cadophora malorum TaxID=108018 RepID=A0A8H7W0E2_9HELO|nr:Kynureninase (L-kynurenine hydrolase) [Cadophora malorum]